MAKRAIGNALPLRKPWGCWSQKVLRLFDGSTQDEVKHTTNPDTIARTSLRDVPCHDLILFATLLQDLALGHVPVGPHWGSRCLGPIRGVQLERPLSLRSGHWVDGDPR